MGQCPVMMPSAEPQSKDEQVQINTLALDAASRSTGIICSLGPRPELSLPKGQSFLRPHDSDRPLRNILHPDEVKQMLTYQAEEYRRQLQKEQQTLPEAPPKLVRNLANYEMSKIWSTSSFESGSSIMAPSEVALTTVSAATEHVSNLDRYAPTSKPSKKGSRARVKEFSVLENLDEDTPSVASSLSVTTSSSSPTNSCDSTPSPGIMDMGSVRRRFQSRIESSGRVEKGSQLGIGPSTTSNKVNGESGRDLACQLLLGPCLGNVHDVSKPRPVDSFALMDDCSDVLHLKMKANLVDFYQYHYLPMFPDSPKPACISTRTPSPVWKKHKHHSRLSSGRMEKAFSSSSSSASTSGGIDYFVGPTSYPLRFFLNDSIFMDLAVTGCLGLVDRPIPRRRHGRSSHYASEQHDDLPNRKSPEHYIVLLHRRSGVPLAVCALKATTSGPPIVRIYATKQRATAQRSVASTQQLGLNWSSDDTSYPLYAWAELIASPQEGMQSFRYDLFLASGLDGRFEPEPSYCASPAEPGSPTIHVVGRTESEESYTGCAILSLESRNGGLGRDDDDDMKNFVDDDRDDDDEPFFRLSIARGIDPALMICLAAIIDEIMEKSMRMQCEDHTRVALRRVRPTANTKSTRDQEVEPTRFVI